MKKSFPLAVPGLKPERVVEAIKRDLNRYLKRERRKPLPEEVDFCDFACKAGPDPATAEDLHVTALAKAVDTASAEGWSAIYLEVIAKPGRRTKKE